MKTDLLLRQTRVHFPRFGEGEVKIAPIEKGGSDRKFYRVRCGAENSLILVKYNLEREENRHYVQIANFLAEHDIRAPRIYFHDAAEGLIWIEDLGERDLWSYQNDSWLVRRAFYDSALDEVAKLHSLSGEAAESIRADLPAEFNATLYRWEQSYFFENCIERHFNIDSLRVREIAALPALNEIADKLGNLPRVLVHRDFQSQNIIVRNGQAHLIDFQGMRPGLAEYDLASLLYDPYVELSDDERAELISHYCAQRGDCGSPQEFAPTLRLCAMQRLMQALGAYGFLGLVKGNRQFLAHIPAAVTKLRSVVDKIDNLQPLRLLLEELS